MNKNFSKVMSVLRQSNILATLWHNVLLGYFPNILLIICKRTKVVIHRTAQVTIKNKIQVGSAWEGTNHSFSTLMVAENAKMIVHGNFDFHTGIFIAVNKNAILEIGSGYTNNDVDISCFKSIKIGNNVAISKGVIIRDSDNHEIGNDGNDISKPIEIGDNVWIGLRAIILKGVKIGNGSIIAAGALVNKDVPANCLAAGVPAMIIKENISWK
ncbi:acyltransferase [Pedobacter agri]|uniref:Acyltransferase n=1 Tax=Pedobacter agri TaxID=454586 RepID=A0A9X3DDG8_9SPHI|nr:acyltransferase [Pedobacter agri]MCX3265297.1 acyltransferase [Pedobacter agri]